MRGGPHKRQPSDDEKESITIVKNQLIRFTVEQRGPLNFIVTPHETKQHFTVTIGSTQNCTCGQTQDVCIHIIYILMRAFKVPVENDVLWQKYLTDHELDAIINGRLAREVRVPQPVYKTKSGKQKVKRQKITEDDTCPICLDEMKKEEKISWCRCGCGGNFHTKCVKEWLVMSQTCPICRTPLSFLGIVEKKKAPPKDSPPNLTQNEINDLLQRDITPDDYLLLLRLDETSRTEAQRRMTHLLNHNHQPRASPGGGTPTMRRDERRREVPDLSPLHITGRNLFVDQHHIPPADHSQPNPPADHPQQQNPLAKRQIRPPRILAPRGIVRGTSEPTIGNMIITQFVKF